MIDAYSEMNTLSNRDVLRTLAQFMDNGSYDNEELLYFVSELTGLSEDKIMETIRRTAPSVTDNGGRYEE